MVADEKYLTLLGFVEKPRLYPGDVWQNTSLPVIVTYVLEGQESQAVGFINNVGKVLPNNTILIYDLGLHNYGLRTVSATKLLICSVVIIEFLVIQLLQQHPLSSSHL